MDRYIINAGSLLSSQLSFRQFNADVLPNSSAPYQLLVETEGGFVYRPDRQSSSVEWQEIFQLAPHKLYGTHNLKAGISFAHSSYDGYEQFQPVNIVGVAGYPLRRVEFSPASTFSIDQNKVAWFVGDKWMTSKRLAFASGASIRPGLNSEFD